MAQLLDQLFGSRIRAKILAWFFTHTDEQFFVRQLTSILREDVANLSRELARLDRLGVLSSSREGNLKYFRVNKSCAFFAELRGLVLKTSGVAGQITRALEGVGGVKAAAIYGSFARGEETAESDVDLFIVGDVNLETLDRLLRKVEDASGRTVNYVLYSPTELRSKLKKKDGFISDVLSGQKLMLIGDIGDAERT